MTKAKAKLAVAKQPAKLVAKSPAPARNYWSGQEAEDVIKLIASGENIAEESEKLDVMIDPETAMVWLRRNKNNRKVSQALVERFTRDMVAGNWPYTHQGIAFDNTGRLIDGQHRLHAIAQSGVTVPMQVSVNMPPEILMAIDQGKNRTTADVATLKAGTLIEANLSAVARGILNQGCRIRWQGTRTEEVDFILSHLTPLLYAIEHLPQKARAGNAMTRAVIARAWHTVDTMRLERFCNILVNGAYAPEEEHVFKLREMIIARGSSGHDIRKDIYAKTEWALSKFVAGETPKQLSKVDKELFLLPEEVTGK